MWIIAELQKLRINVDQRSTYLTLSRLGPRLDRILSLAIHISPNNGAINTVQRGKLVVNVLAMYCAL